MSSRAPTGRGDLRRRPPIVLQDSHFFGKLTKNTMPLTLLFFLPGLMLFLVGGFLVYRRRRLLGIISMMAGLGLIVLPFVLFGLSSM